MPDFLASALATEGLMWIALAAFIAGLVRGFSGFGTAMIYLPIASLFLSPVEALVTLAVLDSLAPIPALPRALREADWPDLRRLLLSLVLCLPIGIWLLLTIPAETFRVSVSIISLLLLGALIFGLRYQGRIKPAQVYAVGGSAGILGGAVGLPGPPVILLYMASPHAAPVIRATTMIFLFSFDIILIVMFGAKGLLTISGGALGLILAVPALFGTIIGTWLFRPEYEKAYRGAAYLIIGVSALRGLPIWG